MLRGGVFVRVLVIADVHGNSRALCRAIEEQPSARTVIFLGDGLRQAEDAEKRYTDRTFYMVPGNCDLCTELPPSREETIGGKRFYFTHGHKQDVKYGLYRLYAAARQAQADIALFGHTHQPYTAYEEGVHLLNPGSLGYNGTYAWVDITANGVLTNIVPLR